MVHLKDFQADAKWIQSRLRKHVPLREIAKTLDFLIEHGFITKETGDEYSTGDKPIRCHDKIFHLTLNQYHTEILALANDAIYKTEATKRQQTQRKISRFEARKEDSAQVYQISLGAFELTKDRRK
jgi:uncharacterized protein (TIGR02147 family)